MMNEQLHALIDGDLTDAEMSNVLDELRNSPDGRTQFLQQTRLQGALRQNGDYAPMSVTENVAMLGALKDAIGFTDVPANIPATTQGEGYLWHYLSPKLVAAMVAILLVGGSLGYMLNNWANGKGGSTELVPGAQVTPDPNTQPELQPAPPVNSDSLVTAIRDSLISAMDREQAAEKPSPKQTLRKKYRDIGTPGDPSVRNQKKSQ